MRNQELRCPAKPDDLFFGRGNPAPTGLYQYRRRFHRVGAGSPGPLCVVPRPRSHRARNSVIPRQAQPDAGIRSLFCVTHLRQGDADCRVASLLAMTGSGDGGVFWRPGEAFLSYTSSPYNAQVLLPVIFTCANRPIRDGSPCRWTRRPPSVRAERL